MRDSALLCLVVAVAGVAASPGMMFGPEDGPREQANYTIIKQTETYEVRDFGATSWVCSEIVLNPDKDRKIRKKKMTMMWGLFEYMNGDNSMDMEIQMALPMLMRGEDIGEGLKRMQMCFYLPSALHDLPPLPLDPEVYINTKTSFKVAVRMFNGWMMEMSDWEMQKAALMQDLKTTREKGVDFNKYYGAIYSSPMDREGLRNEIWFEVA